MIIEKWMGEEDDLLRIRVRSLTDELKKDIPCATREKLAGEKARIETYRQWSQKVRADVELRDLRREYRDLKDFSEWLLSKVEGHVSRDWNESALKEAEEKAERDQRIEDEHMRQGSS